jgi:hypothetical protein
MPFENVDHPIYGDGHPAFLRAKKKEGFDNFVFSVMSSKDMSEDKFAELFEMRWNSFSKGLLDESIVFIDIIAAHRLGFTVDLQRLYEVWLERLKERTEREAATSATVEPEAAKAPWWRKR